MNQELKKLWPVKSNLEAEILLLGLQGYRVRVATYCDQTCYIGLLYCHPTDWVNVYATLSYDELHSKIEKPNPKSNGLTIRTRGNWIKLKDVNLDFFLDQMK